MKGYVLNGEVVLNDRLTIEFHQPFFAHGHGLFETTRAVGGRPAFMKEHVERMALAAPEVGLVLPYEAAEIDRQARDLLQQLGLSDARVKLHLLARHEGQDFLITAEDLPPYQELSEVSALTEPQGRFGRTLDLAGLKTLNYMGNRLVEAEARKRGFQEAIFVTSDGFLAEGSRSNLFFARAGKWHTPSLELPILPGITRAALIDLARREGQEVVEGRFTWADLEAADEAFLSGSVSSLRPVNRVREQELEHCPGPMTVVLARAYAWVMKNGLC